MLLPVVDKVYFIESEHKTLLQRNVDLWKYRFWNPQFQTYDDQTNFDSAKAHLLVLSSLSEVNSELTDACLELQFLSGRDEASYVIPLHLPFLDIKQRLSSSLVPLKPWLENMALVDLNKEIVFIPSRNI